MHFENDGVLAPEILGALVGKSTIKKLKLQEHCTSNHFQIIMEAATNSIEVLSVDIRRRPGDTNPNVMALAGALSKMTELSELNLSFSYYGYFDDGDYTWYDEDFTEEELFSEEAKRKLLCAVEQLTALTTVTLDDPRNHFTPDQSQKLRTCSDRNVLLRLATTVPQQLFLSGKSS